ncbi:hypothetical protein M0765_012755 [Variovorax sp. S2]|uniref:hypothetical protein n=1 Tax=Variovorax sp. S12S4 TaxID=3029170 RepID=UPI00215CDC7C|nr:hypothetical protein [Variovorax sp. S12S4]MCR8958563.1 hypothetical protein [Variovorax sp. S12S4]
MLRTMCVAIFGNFSDAEIKKIARELKSDFSFTEDLHSILMRTLVAWDEGHGEAKHSPMPMHSEMSVVDELYRGVQQRKISRLRLIDILHNLGFFFDDAAMDENLTIRQILESFFLDSTVRQMEEFKARIGISSDPYLKGIVDSKRGKK